MKKFKRKSPRRNAERSIEEKLSSQPNSMGGKKKSLSKGRNEVGGGSLPRAV